MFHQGSLSLLMCFWNFGFLLPKCTFQVDKNSYIFKTNIIRIVASSSLLISQLIMLMQKLETYGITHINSLVHLSHNIYFVCYLFVAIYIVHKDSKKLQTILMRIRKINLNLDKSISDENSMPRTEMYWLISVLILGVLLFLLEIYLNVIHNTPFSILFTMTARYICYFLDIQLQYFYVAITHILRYISNFSERVKNLEKKIKMVDEIGQISLSLLDAWSPIIFFVFGNIFFAIIVSQFGNLTDKEKSNIWYIVLLWIWFIASLMSCLKISGNSAAVVFERKNAIENISDVQTKIGRKGLPYKNMELFLLKSKLNELKFSVGGFFPLNWTLIYSMVSGIATYLVFLIQFREMEQNRMSQREEATLNF